MPTVFERRRLATTAEMAALVASFDAPGLDLDKAEVSEQTFSEPIDEASDIDRRYS